MRNAIVDEITSQWPEYQNSIIGNPSYIGTTAIMSCNDYKLYMGTLGNYGTDVEINAFTRIHNIGVDVEINHENIVSFGGNHARRIRLQYTGELDNGHYDVILPDEVLQDRSMKNISRIKKCRQRENENSKNEEEEKKEKRRCRQKGSENSKNEEGKKGKSLENEEKNKGKKIEKRKNYCYGDKSNKFENNVHDVGDMTVKCKYCNALSFNGENGRVSNNCCHHGKIKLPPFHEYPDELKQLLKDEKSIYYNRFRKNIRSYNSTFAFATFHANHSVPTSAGPYLMKIYGQVYHMATTSLHSENNPRNGQIYLYDANEANLYRLNTSNTDPKIVAIIENELRCMNPYAKMYYTLNQKYVATNQEELTLNFVRLESDDLRRYNHPVSGEIAALIVSKDGSIPHNVDLCVYPKHKEEYTIMKKNSAHVDPMCFPILFPKGDVGWCYNLMSNDKHVTPLQYYSYRLAYREDSSILLYAGALTQQYIIHAYIIVESNRLSYIKFNQGSLRTECYQGVVDHIEGSRANSSNSIPLGNLIVLPATYIGSPRNMQQLYLDAMTIARKVGRPDLFITMTCNPKWSEFKRILQKFPKSTTIQDIPTIVCRVFQMKVDSIIKEITSGTVFGPITGYVYTIEFQKRGLPHCHMLFIMRDDYKLITSDDVDRYISAEIPDRECSDLYKAVIKHMLHGPHVSGLPCWDDVSNVCSKKFPKSYINETDMSSNGYPQYRRRDNRNELHEYNARNNNGQKHYVDNSMVVPYNAYLLQKYDCHINVEYCASVLSIKYIHKYIHKGHDRAKITIDDKNDNDEIKQYIDTRYLSAMESAWRLLEIPLHNRSHAVIRLPIHLKNQQYVCFKEGDEHEVVMDEKKTRTPLIGWFNLNKIDQEAKKYLYAEIPKYYRWDVPNKQWIKRKIQIRVISRTVSVSPRDNERFNMKLLLTRMKGVTSYEELRTVDGHLYDNFREAAIQAGLSCHSREAEELMNEAVNIMMPQRLRNFFIWYLIGEMPPDVMHLWNKFKKYMSDDFQGDEFCKEQQVLQNMQISLQKEGLNLGVFGLPNPQNEIIEQNLQVSASMDVNIDVDELIRTLNQKQKRIFDEINLSINEDTNKYFYIDGPGGSGKTYLYKTLYHYLTNLGLHVVAVAWTGIASILLPNGTTAHKMFNLPLNMNDDNAVCNLNMNQKSKLFDVNVIIWDEASMIPKTAIEMIDRTLRDLMKVDVPFGGKKVILGGDFRQIMPVVKRSGKNQIINNIIKNSYLWNYFTRYELDCNMRAGGNAEFSQWLMEIGNGNVEKISVDSSMRCDNLVTNMYGSGICEDHLSRKAILAVRNVDANKINNEVVKMIKGEDYCAYSIDHATLPGTDKSDESEEATLRYPIEYINSLNPASLPPHELNIKVGVIVMLIRNLSVSSGLCNGTRLIVRKIYKRVLITQILTGDKKGDIAEIPRIELNTSEDKDLPFVLYRRQFPVKLAFAMTINKSQGQSFEEVGLFMNRDVFSHGQLYVALSRCTQKKNIKIQTTNNELKNIVYKEVL